METWTWPGLFTCYLVSYDNRYWAWTQPPEPGSPPQATELPAEAAARARLTAVRARLVLSLPAEKLLAAAEARDLTGKVLFAAAAADSGPGTGVWLATWETDGTGAHTMTRHPGRGAAVAALADAADAAAARIAGMPIPLAAIAAAHLRRRAALARAAAAAAAEGDAIRASSETIRAGRAIAAVAQMTDTGITSLYEVLTGEEWTWGVTSWPAARPDPRPAARRSTGQRPPTARLVVNAAGENRALAEATGVFFQLHVTVVGELRIAPLGDDMWTVEADIDIPGLTRLEHDDSRSRAMYLAGRLDREDATWTIRQDADRVQLSWPPDAAGEDPGVLVSPAVRSAEIVAPVSASTTRGGPRSPVPEPPAAGTGTARNEEYAALLATLAPVFARPEPHRRAEQYLAGLLAGSPHLDGWVPPAPAVDTAASVRRLLKTDAWSAGYARDQLRDYVIRRLGSTEAVLVAGETGFPKQGNRSAGVARQYNAAAGRTMNCQVGLFLGYAAPAGRQALVDRELYLPEEWTSDRPRCRAAGIADSIGYRDHAQLAEAMISRAVAAQVPCAWLTTDSAAMHSPRLREQAAAAGLRYVLPVAGSFAVRSPAGHVQRAEQMTALAAPGDWQLLPEDDWAGGPSQAAEWLLQPTADLNYPLLARRKAGSRAADYFTCAAPPGTPVQDLAAVTGARRALRVCLATARAGAGLDDYLARQYEGWYRHITLAMFALAFIAALPPRAVMSL